MSIIITILIVVGAVILLYLGYLVGRKLGRMQAEKDLPDIIRAAREDSAKRSRSVLSGQFSEQLAPYFPDFPYSPTECRFIGKPIDFLVFKGMDEKDIGEIVFVEVKSGKSQLTVHERKLKDAIQNKRVAWEEYRIPEK